MTNYDKYGTINNLPLKMVLPGVGRIGAPKGAEVISCVLISQEMGSSTLILVAFSSKPRKKQLLKSPLMFSI